MLGLVNYESSDSEDENSNNHSDKDEQPNSLSKSAVASSSFDIKSTSLTSEPKSNLTKNQNEEIEKELSKCSSIGLPTPKAKEVSGLLLSGGSLKSAVHAKKGNKVKILLPSFKNLPEDEIEEDPSNDVRKRVTPSSNGSGLTSLLPPPKKSKLVATVSKTTSFIPHTMRSRTVPTKPVLPKPKTSALNKNDDDDNEETSGNEFFTFESPSTSIASSLNSINPTPLASTSAPSGHLDFNIKPCTDDGDDDDDGEEEFEQQTHVHLDEQSRLRHLIEKGFGDHVESDLQIVDVDMSKHMNHNLDYLKSVSEETEKVSTGPLPSGQAKRKHQITYLAFQAKQNEIKLKNEWARNRNTKAQAKARYGF